MTATTDTAKRLLALNAEKDQLEARLKEINAEREKLTASIIDRWADEGIESLKVDGKLISLRRQAFATILDGNYERAAAALKAAGLESLLRPNTQTLSAYLREREESGEGPPASFEGAIGVYERFSLSVRNGR